MKYFLSPEAKAAYMELTHKRPTDAGLDLRCVGPVTIPSGGFELVPTGLHVEIPEGYFGLVRDRSSVALKGGVCVAGVIDSSYRGEIKVAMHNLGKLPLEFAAGERFAQMILIPHFAIGELALVASVDELSSTDRGSGGFGSTGR
jgi:dUTP pyrophosphatase